MWRHPLGEVSGGTDASTGARIQVMALNPGSVVSDALLDAGRQAARVAAAVSIPAVVRPIDLQRMADGRIAIATEPLEGTPLTNVSRNQPLPATRTVAVLRQLCKALAAVHEVGLVHRALTLGSLVLRARTDRPDTVAVTDFGLGPLLDGEVAILKEDAALQPVSPERLSGAQQDIREDLYLMGCIAYSLFTGGAPFRTGTADAVRRRHAIEDPMPIADRLKGTRGVHPALAAWVHRCLAKEPDDRFEDAAQAEAALCLAQIEAHVETPWDDLAPPDVEAATVAKIVAGLRRRPEGAARTDPDDEEADDDVTVLRRPSHPSPEGQTTIVRNVDGGVFEMADAGSTPIDLDRLEPADRADASDRGDTVVGRAEDTVAGVASDAHEDTTAGPLPQRDEDTSVGALDDDRDAQREQTRRSSVPSEDTSVGSVARDDTVSASLASLVHGPSPRPSAARVVPTPEPPEDPEPVAEIAELEDPFELDPADRTQISRAPSLPFSPAPIAAPRVPEIEMPEPGDRTMVAPAAVVTFDAAPALVPPLRPAPLLARPPSSTPTVPAGTAIDPRILPSSASTLPGVGVSRDVVLAGADAGFEAPDRTQPRFPGLQPIIPPSMEPTPGIEAAVIEAPVIEAPVIEAPVIPAPVVAAPVVAAPVIEAPVIEAPVVAAPVIVPPPAPVIAAPPVEVPPAVVPPPAMMRPPTAPSGLPPMVVPAGVLPPNLAPPWPSSPSGLTGQYTSANASFSSSDMDASMIASIGGSGRTIKLIAVVLIVAVVVSGGLYLILRPPPAEPAAPVATAEKAPPPVRIEKVTTPVDDPAADLAATPNDLVAAGDRALADGRSGDAQALYQRAIVREPKHLGALLGLGRMQLGAGDVEKAAGYFRRAVGANPNDGGARIALGDALVKQGNVAEARKQYKKAKSLRHPDAAGRLAAL